MVICDSDYAQAHGLEPLAIVRSWASAGLPPADTGLGPTLAIPKALERAGVADGRHGAGRDQRGVRVDGGRVEPDPGVPARDRERQRQRVQPRPPGRVHRRPYDHDTHVRAAATRWRHTASRACAPVAAWARRPCSRCCPAERRQRRAADDSTRSLHQPSSSPPVRAFSQPSWSMTPTSASSSCRSNQGTTSTPWRTSAARYTAIASSFE